MDSYCHIINEKIVEVNHIQRITGLKKILKIGIGTGFKEQLIELAKEVIEIIEKIPISNKVSTNKKIYINRSLRDFFNACCHKILLEYQSCKSEDRIAKLSQFFNQIRLYSNNKKIIKKFKFRYPDVLDFTSLDVIHSIGSITATQAA
ncbi:MAG: hypothetical protein VW397_07370 [Candidatus Margulisiibacteriota bacterium]